MSKFNLTWHTNSAQKTVPKQSQAGAVLSLTSININGPALYLLENPGQVVLAYDATSKVIAIKAYDPDNSDDSLVIYDISKKLKNGSVTIRSKDFMGTVIKQMSLYIEGKKKISCPVELNSRKKLLIIHTAPIEEVESE